MRECGEGRECSPRLTRSLAHREDVDALLTVLVSLGSVEVLLVLLQLEEKRGLR